MIPQRTLGITIIGWSLITWGGRIGLLTGAESDQIWTWVRIAGSLVTAFAAGIGLLMALGAVRVLVAVYGALAVVVWGTSLVSVFGDAETTAAFKLVHSVLAVISLALALVAVKWVFNPQKRESDPVPALEQPSSTVR